MQLSRIFTTAQVKGKKGYIKTQKKYEIMRTAVYFILSLSLFAIGWITTGTRLNLLTIVAVLGCLPASKSAVNMILFLRYQGCSEESAEKIAVHSNGMDGLFDCIFTSYERCYEVAHLVVVGNTICGFTESKNFDESGFCRHLGGLLQLEHVDNIAVKIFSDRRKYLERLAQLGELESDIVRTEQIIALIKNVTL